MSISQNSKIIWTDIRALFDRVNAERNRFGYTPDGPLNLQNQKAEASIPNRLNTLISDMKSNSFIANNTSINNVASFTVRSGDRISFTSIERMSELLSEIEDVKPYGRTGEPLICSQFNFCNAFGQGFSKYELGGFTSFNGRHGSGYSGGFRGCTQFHGTVGGDVKPTTSNRCNVFAFSGSGGNGGNFNFNAASYGNYRRTSVGSYSSHWFCASGYRAASGITGNSTYCNAGFGFCTSSFNISFHHSGTICNDYGTSGTPCSQNVLFRVDCFKFTSGCTGDYCVSHTFGFSGFNNNYCLSGFCASNFCGANYFNSL